MIFSMETLCLKKDILNVDTLETVTLPDSILCYGRGF